jgi:pimeloyl-ACP methyl ester carboxylesterase
MDKKKKFDVGRLAVATGGVGDPALFVHGFGSNKLIWQEVCEGLADVFSFYAIDLPGSGDSPAPRNFRYTLEQLADVLTDFIVLKDFKKLTLVGASLGGTVILLALLRNKDQLAARVQSLCLVDAVAYPQDFPLFVDLLRGPVLGPLVVGLPSLSIIGDLVSLSQEYAQFYGRKRVREALVTTARLMSTDRLRRYSRRLPTIDLPALVIWGREDGVVPLRLGKRLARDLPNAQLLVIDDCGHSPHQERPAEVVAALQEFARKTCPGAAGIAGEQHHT